MLNEDQGIGLLDVLCLFSCRLNSLGSRLEMPTVIFFFFPNSWSKLQQLLYLSIFYIDYPDFGLKKLIQNKVCL